MPVPTQEDLDLYGKLLQEIKARTVLAAAYLQHPNSLPPLEIVALNLRMTIELIVMGPLVTNRTEAEAVAKAFATKKPHAVRKLLDRINPRYWPEPIHQRWVGPEPSNFFLEPITDPYLTKEDAWTEWGNLSERLLHAVNPYKRAPYDVRSDIAELHAWLTDLYSRIVRLMNHHIMHPIDEVHPVIGLMQNPQGKIEVVVFKRRDTPPPST